MEIEVEEVRRKGIERKMREEERKFEEEFSKRQEVKTPSRVSGRSK